MAEIIKKRKRSKVALLAGIAVIAFVSPAVKRLPADQSAPGEETVDVKKLLDSRWTPERAFAYMDRFGVIKGCNYVPRYDYSVNQMWYDFREKVLQEELAWARDIGLNSVRVWVGCFLFQSDRDRLHARFERFLDICAKNGISVMPVLQPTEALDPDLSPGAQKEPTHVFRPGVHLGPDATRWIFPGVISWETKWPRIKPAVREFVQAFLRRYANEKRIIAWDLGNEAREDARPIVQGMFAWAREVNPSQPLTACWVGQEYSDIWTFHSYNRPGEASTKNPDYHITFDGEMETAVSSGRPILCTEFMARTLGSTLDVVLPHFAKHGVGWYVWGLCAGSGQYQFPWDWPEGSPEPKLWFHCLLYPDGSPYRVEEIDLIRRFKFDGTASARK